ncbi:Gamma-aminobutyric acid receptor subunit pi [Liparis tanakae]|uniref:Gamma-aminobutyric acid receptor subunit pi n=1 Tax=Liparis tanakae TaxID=230148 RepID=A0A4Z2F4U2_9TELE|nr:Gamma-aminobutyric acid receptor subunit pi [Liparis tanakae]
MSVRLPALCLTLFLTFTQSGSTSSNNQRAEWKDSQLQPTIQKLMKGYNRYLRPNFNEGPVEIGMSLDIASIDAVSEINMDYTATIFLRQRWRDSRLVFPGNESVSVDGRLVSLLWIPDTFIPDSKRSFLHDVTVENRLIRIFSNGTVLYALRSSSSVDASQLFAGLLLNRGYNLQDVVFYWTRGNDSVKGLDILRLAQYSVESYYTSVSEAVYETGQYPKLVLHFALRRNVLFFILETYVPSVLLVVLSWVSFWISQSSDLQRELNEVNGNGSAHMLRSIQPSRSAADAGTAAGALEKALGRRDAGCCGRGLSSVKDASRRVAAVFTVENPYDIDRRARSVFPTAFLFVNVLYWLYYLFL